MKIDDSEIIDSFIKKGRNRKPVVVQGLGFVGSAMLTATAASLNKDNLPLYNCIGVDLSTEPGLRKIGCINNGKLPIATSDGHFLDVFSRCFKIGNIMATADEYAYSVADIVIVDINLDVQKCNKNGSIMVSVSLDAFLSAMRTIASRIKPSCLVIIESTVPPGLCEKVIAPLFKKEFTKRKLTECPVNLCHSYERVMPGKDYLKSITSFYRVFSGINEMSRKKARIFLESVIDTRNFPLTEFASTTASEMGKVLENSYRATNIAFMQEWTEFAEIAGINLFDVISGIKKRETHKNIMLPGFGVGGYCLTKDPLLADWSNRMFFNRKKNLGFSVSGVEMNEVMPLHSFSILKKQLKSLEGKRIAILGVSYRSDVGDTRFSPCEKFFLACRKAGAEVVICDPLVDYWQEMKIKVESNLSALRKRRCDAMVLAVGHRDYINLNPIRIEGFLKPKALILDSCNGINDSKAVVLRKMGFCLAGVGKGHWARFLERKNA